MGQPRQAGVLRFIQRDELVGNGNNSDNVYNVKDDVYDVKDDDVDVLGNDNADEYERENIQFSETSGSYNDNNNNQLILIIN